MALHEQCTGATDEWYTPPYIFEAMEVQFDMDVASPGKDVVSWIPAVDHVTQNSLTKPWSGFLWVNPPFGPRNGLVPWLKKFFEHGCGVALVPDRTSAPWWQQFVPAADLVLFVSPKIKFVGADGKPGKSPAQGTCLLAVGELGVVALRNAARNGLGVLMTPIRPKSRAQRLASVEKAAA
jgi:DNA N-6-adenine-methyltransferase (Dam)